MAWPRWPCSSPSRPSPTRRICAYDAYSQRSDGRRPCLATSNIRQRTHARLHPSPHPDGSRSATLMDSHQCGRHRLPSAADPASRPALFRAFIRRCSGADIGAALDRQDAQKAGACVQVYPGVRLPENLDQDPPDNKPPEDHSQKNGKYDPPSRSQHASVMVAGVGNRCLCRRKCPWPGMWRGVQSDRTRVNDTALIRKRGPTRRWVAHTGRGIRLFRRLELRGPCRTSGWLHQQAPDDLLVSRGRLARRHLSASSHFCPNVVTLVRFCIQYLMRWLQTG